MVVEVVDFQNPKGVIKPHDLQNVYGYPANFSHAKTFNGDWIFKKVHKKHHKIGPNDL